MALHELSAAIEPEEWYTPAHVFHAMGQRFDLDPAHPPRNDLPVDDWMDTRVSYYTKAEDGLRQPWRAWETRTGRHPRVWLNPPFGKRNEIVPWLQRFMEHGNGVALTPDRTSAPWWQHFAPQACAILFISPKLKFLSPIGLAPAGSPAQGTTLMARGQESIDALMRAERAGLGKVWRRP